MIIWIIPPALKRWFYPAYIEVRWNHGQTYHNEPYDGKPTRLRGWFKFGRLLDLARANAYVYKGRPVPYRAWRLWWYTAKPSAGYVDFYVDLRDV